MITALCLNYCLAMGIILSRLKNNYIYSTVSFTYKTNESDWNSFEFLKLAGNFCLIIMISLIVEKYVPLGSKWASLIMCATSILIIIRWNSREFLKRSLEILRGFIGIQSNNGVSFDEVLVADVWTSFSKPTSQLISSNHMILKVIILS